MNILLIGCLFPTWGRSDVAQFVMQEVAAFQKENGTPPDEIWFCDSKGERICRWPDTPPLPETDR